MYIAPVDLLVSQGGRSQAFEHQLFPQGKVPVLVMFIHGYHRVLPPYPVDS